MPVSASEQQKALSKRYILMGIILNDNNDNGNKSYNLSFNLKKSVNYPSQYLNSKEYSIHCKLLFLSLIYWLHFYPLTPWNIY